MRYLSLFLSLPLILSVSITGYASGEVPNTDLSFMESPTSRNLCQSEPIISILDPIERERNLSTPIWSYHSNNILHRLIGDDSRAFLGFLPHLAMTEALEPNAFAIGPNNLILSYGLFDRIESSSELAFVLAHELGHLVLGHRGETNSLSDADRNTPVPFSLVQQEVAADSFALTLMKRSGFQPEASANLLRKLGRYGHEEGFPFERVFPTIAIRLKAIEQSIPRQPH